MYNNVDILDQWPLVLGEGGSVEVVSDGGRTPDGYTMIDSRCSNAAWDKSCSRPKRFSERGHGSRIKQEVDEWEWERGDDLNMAGSAN